MSTNHTMTNHTIDDHIITSLIDHLKTCTHLTANNHSLDETINECMHSLIASIGDNNCHHLSDESIKDNKCLDDLDLSEDFWDDFDFETNLDTNSGDNDINHQKSEQQLTTTSVDTSLDFKPEFELLLTELTAKSTANDRSAVDVSAKSLKMLGQLDAINDAIIGLINCLKRNQSSNVKI